MIENQTVPIYTQVAQIISEDILCGKWKSDDRIPSVRDFAGQYEVNPNTVMRAFEMLVSQDVIYIKRGMGYYVKSGAYESILSHRKEAFLNNTLSEVAHQMSLLKITINEVVEQLNKYTDEKI
jgi:Predicted transcriptional regulators